MAKGRLQVQENYTSRSIPYTRNWSCNADLSTSADASPASSALRTIHSRICVLLIFAFLSASPSAGSRRMSPCAMTSTTNVRRGGSARSSRMRSTDRPTRVSGRADVKETRGGRTRRGAGQRLVANHERLYIGVVCRRAVHVADRHEREFETGHKELEEFARASDARRDVLEHCAVLLAREQRVICACGRIRARRGGAAATHRSRR
jgi:hypothetical protein